MSLDDVYGGSLEVFRHMSAENVSKPSDLPSNIRPDLMRRTVSNSIGDESLNVASHSLFFPSNRIPDPG